MLFTLEIQAFGIAFTNVTETLCYVCQDNLSLSTSPLRIILLQIYQCVAWPCTTDHDSLRSGRNRIWYLILTLYPPHIWMNLSSFHLNRFYPFNPPFTHSLQYSLFIWINGHHPFSSIFARRNTSEMLDIPLLLFVYSSLALCPIYLFRSFQPKDSKLLAGIIIYLPAFLPTYLLTYYQPT